VVRAVVAAGVARVLTALVNSTARTVRPFAGYIFVGLLASYPRYNSVGFFDLFDDRLARLRSAKSTGAATPSAVIKQCSVHGARSCRQRSWVHLHSTSRRLGSFPDSRGVVVVNLSPLRFAAEHPVREASWRLLACQSIAVGIGRLMRAHGLPRAVPNAISSHNGCSRHT